MAEDARRHVIVAGSSGLIGSELVATLRADGFRVTTLVRRAPRSPDEVEWLTASGAFNPAVLEGADAVVGLSGATIGRFPWTAHYKRTLRRSRLGPARTLARAIRALGAGAPAYLSASAVGYYGSAPGRELTEASAQGDTFLARLCGEWEAAALEAGDDARVVLLRTAPVVHVRGVLRPLMVLTRLGVSGPIGSGAQRWPWISLPDEVRAIRHLIDNTVAGPVNLVGPTLASANDLGVALARRMHRPFVVPAPEPLLRLALGRDATESLLTSDAAVRPAALESSGFRYLHPTVEDAVAAAVPSA